MLWKVRVLDQTLFTDCISKKKLQNYLENNMGIATAVVEIQSLRLSKIDSNWLSPEVMVNVDQRCQAKAVSARF